jgi:hypothetical protein
MPTVPTAPIVPVGLGDLLGDQLKSMIASAFDAAMTAIWTASLGVLKGAFGLADAFSAFTVSTTDGPLKILWPVMLWISGMLALGLFFWQLALTNLRGGKGFMRLVTGPVQYGIALAVTVGMVATFLTATDALTDGILSYGLQAKNFTDAFNHTSLGGAENEVVDAVVLGICAFIGVIPSAIGYVLEMLFREAAIYVLVATVPIVAAGLLANVTSIMFWRTVRWLMAAIGMKPVLAIALVIGVAVAGGSQGVAGLLAGVGVLIVSLFCPFVLFRLFAFVDPNTDAGAGFRDALSGLGISSYGSDNAAFKAAGALDSYAKSGGDGGEGGGDAIEKANTGRFDEAAADQASDSMDKSGVGQPGSGDSDHASPQGSSSGSSGGGSGGGGGEPEQPGGGDSTGDGQHGGADGGGGGHGEGEPPEPPPASGGPPSPPPPPGGGGGGGGSHGGGSHGGGAEGEAEEAAVAL